MHYTSAVGSVAKVTNVVHKNRQNYRHPDCKVQNMKYSKQTYETRHIPVRSRDEETLRSWALVSVEAPLDMSATSKMKQGRKVQERGIIIL